MSHNTITDIEAGKDFSVVLDRVRGGSRVRVECDGKLTAIIIPASDLEILDRLEDLLEDEWAQEAVSKALKQGGKPVSAEKVWKSLGL